MTTISNGGAAQRVKVLTDADLKANGGSYSLEGRAPVAVYGVVDAETKAQGGQYAVMGNVLQPVYVVDAPVGAIEATIAPIPMIAVDGELAIGNTAIPVYVVGGSLGGLPAPTNLTLAITGAGLNVITATWDAVTGATTYEIEYSDDGVTYTPVDTTALLTYDLINTDYDPDAVTHYVRVRAVGGVDWAVATVIGAYLNLISAWELEDTNWTDSIGANDGTAGGSPAIVPGKLGNGVDIVADTDKVFVASNANLQSGDSDWAVAVWFNPSALTLSVINGKDDLDTGGGREWLLLMDGANHPFLLVNNGAGTQIGSVIDTASTLSIGTWMHMVGYHSATNNEVGVRGNNNAFATSATTGAGGTSGADFVIAGREEPNAVAKGIRDQVLWWKGRVPSVGQLNYIFNSGNGRALPWV